MNTSSSVCITSSSLHAIQKLVMMLNFINGSAFDLLIDRFYFIADSRLLFQKTMATKQNKWGDTPQKSRGDMTSCSSFYHIIHFHELPTNTQMYGMTHLYLCSSNLSCKTYGNIRSLPSDSWRTKFWLSANAYQLMTGFPFFRRRRWSGWWIHLNDASRGPHIFGFTAHYLTFLRTHT